MHLLERLDTTSKHNRRMQHNNQPFCLLQYYWYNDKQKPPCKAAWLWAVQNCWTILGFSSSDEDGDFWGDGGLFEDKDVDVDKGGVAQLPQQVAKKQSTRYARLCKTESNWWKLFYPSKRGRQWKTIRMVEMTRNSNGCAGFPTMCFTGCFCLLLQFQSGS